MLLAGVLHFVPDNDDPYGAVTRIRAALAPGSCLALSHAADDLSPAGDVSAGTRAYRPVSSGLTLRSRAHGSSARASATTAGSLSTYTTRASGAARCATWWTLSCAGRPAQLTPYPGQEPQNGPIGKG